jgi:hypothetical protein
VRRAADETQKQMEEIKSCAVAEKEAAWRAAFRPHAMRPEPISFCVDRRSFTTLAYGVGVVKADLSEPAMFSY